MLNPPQHPQTNQLTYQFKANQEEKIKKILIPEFNYQFEKPFYSVISQGTIHELMIFLTLFQLHCLDFVTVWLTVTVVNLVFRLNCYLNIFI